LSDRHKGYVRNFSNYITDLEAVMEQVVLPDCPPPYFALAHSMGAAVALRASHDGSRWFERTVLSAPMIALPAGRLTRVAGPIARLMRMIGRGGAYVPSGDSAVTGSESFIGNVLTSDPVRYARNVAVLEAEPKLAVAWPSVAWADSAFNVMRAMAEPGYSLKIRHPILVVAAGHDQIVSTPAIDEFAIRLRAGRHLIVAGARHELLMEQDRYRMQVLAAFDAFVPGTPLFG
jgi:lysophospholipase